MKKILLIVSLIASTLACAMQESHVPATYNVWLLGVKPNEQTSRTQITTDIHHEYINKPTALYKLGETLYFRLSDSRQDIIRKLQRYEWFSVSNLYPDVEVSAKLPEHSSKP